MRKKKLSEEEKVESQSIVWQAPLLRLIVIILVIAVGLSLLFVVFREFTKDDNQLDKTATSYNQDGKLLENIGKKIVLPEGQPVITTIINSGDLKNKQQFFAAASDGDVLLMYAQLAVLYRPSIERVINSAILTIAGDKPAEAMSAPIKIEIRNGSDRQGAASDLAEKLAKDKQWQVVAINNAATTTYQGLTVVGLGQIDVKVLAENLQATITSTLPVDEASSTAEAIILIGN